VRCPLTGRWHIVHWIDSKASFGDDRLHAQALEGQYRTYTNRYGSGAVIYWLGFVRDLAEGGGSGSSGGGGGGSSGEVLLLAGFPPAGDVRVLTGGAQGEGAGAAAAGEVEAVG
jgi:hypothetical protein